MFELLYPLQWNGYTPLHFAAKGGHTNCVEHLLSTPGIDVNIEDRVSWSTEIRCKNCNWYGNPLLMQPGI